MDQQSHAQRPFHVLVKPIGSTCNLQCKYCFYLNKGELYPHTQSFRMTEDTLETLTRQYLEGQPDYLQEIQFAWQGGEPTLLGVEFFRRALAYQRKYQRPGLTVTNAFQTNGTLLNDEWGQFLREERFLVGLSIDGPEELHNRYRQDRHGHGTFALVMRGLEVLIRHQVEFNTLTVVNRTNANQPEQIYDFLVNIGSRYLQFIPNVQFVSSDQVSDESVEPEQYGTFMCGVFDRWLQQNDVGRVFVQTFDTILGLVMGYPSSLCVHSDTCGRAVALEHNGDLYSCDHFVTPSCHLGNIHTTSLNAMVDSPAQTAFGKQKSNLPGRCRSCRFLRLCHSACPAQRWPTGSKAGKARYNYLCTGYYAFFAHTLPVWQAMANCLRSRRPASEYRARMSEIVAVERQKLGRNDPCPCGSGRKVKHCCG